MSRCNWAYTNSPSTTQDESNSKSKPIGVRKSIRKSIKQSNIMRDLYKLQKYRDLVDLNCTDVSKYEEYEEIRVQGQQIQVGECVIVKNEDVNEEDFIGSIHKIISIIEPVTQKLICLCQIRWFLNRKDISKLGVPNHTWIADNELFKSDSIDYIQAQSIAGPCQVLPYEEYQNLKEVDGTIYFSRLKWNDNTKIIEGIGNLEQYCYCQQPFNPDQAYIQCDLCSEWYHVNCVGVQLKDFKDKEYLCGKCR